MIFKVSRSLCRVFGVAAIIVSIAPAANAGVIDEIWVGAYAHDVSDLHHAKESDTKDTLLEVDTVQPRFLRSLGAPRFNATVALNSAGRTNFASVGLVWDHRLAGPFFGSFQFGIGQSDGVIAPPAGAAGDYDRDHRLLLGSRTLFREALGLDWRYASRLAVGLQYVHASNGEILGHRFNEGINDVGLRLGYRFN